MGLWEELEELGGKALDIAVAPIEALVVDPVKEVVIDPIKDITGVTAMEEAAEEGAASVERAAERQLSYEMARLEEETRRFEINRLEEQSRYIALTEEEQRRHNDLLALNRHRYNSMSAEEKRRYNQREQFYRSLTAEEKNRYETDRREEQGRYETELARVEAMTEEERRRYDEQFARVEEMTEEERLRFGEMTALEQSRYASLTQEEQSRYAAATTEEQKRFELLTEEEKSRWGELRGEEQRRYETQLLGQAEKLERAEEALKPFATSAEVAQQQLQVELGLAPGEAGRAYMETPGYQAALDERTRQVEQEMATMGAAYSGRRLEEAAKATSDVQSQYYQNYMNMLGSMASPETAKTLASLGVSQPEVTGQLGGTGQLYAGRPDIQGQLQGMGALTMGQPGAGQPAVMGSPYLSGPSGSSVYATPGGGAMPVGTPVSWQQPGTGQLTMGQLPGTGNIPGVGTGLTAAAQQAAQMRMGGAAAYQALMGDLIGAGAQAFGGYMAGGGGMGGGGGGYI